ncbi:1-deoxy-D-xylulose-5-phosphate synthase (plasmid) [Streptomyces sp. YIM 121038]|uniref:1-deoxy-D-xylulose-5-phosphate synthase n=1 Tax=Streptomyces sp. YIM 121038 TaxID=2136401 RepID=UPI0011107EAA|nr:1-deoxy-D-xylulose-5-phosphate synthase [Streptomyces sp. YIM 121038]QCX82698.1 1-deoxy-D-xylulose-5-phosphate synthase [Streptomyces sp. YIM 121038]
MAVSSPVQTSAPVLSGLDGPGKLRAVPVGDLPRLAGEVRAFLIEKVCAMGGHLGPNLGMVELTLALHRVFDSPRDALVFDTGHQAYVHKILTGRREGFGTLRQQGGLSGYPSRAESVHDLVENSHASTALSYADGLAKAYALSGQGDRAVVAVIGDGALTGGMAWEALNNIGAASGRPVVVVLNDNGRSYAPTTGALAAHLAALRQDGGMQACRNVFTDLGFTYFGPVDGHNVAEVEAVLRRARALGRPVMVHAITVKGKGYGPAEADEADCLHAVGSVDPATGAPHTPSGLSWTDVFGQTLAEIAAGQQDVVALTAAMLRPTGLHLMAQRFPGRVFDVGIAEQHAVTCAAGLAMGGFHPVVALYATFLNRAVDQVLMDVALHRLPVTFVADRAGITGPDGPSHHGMWDLALLSAVPGLRIAAPRDPARLRSLLKAACQVQDGPTALRIPKTTAGPDIEAVARIGGIDILYRSPHRPLDILLIPIGPLASAALEAAVLLEEQGLGVTVADPGWVLPVNPALPALVARHRLAVTIEDGIRTGGVGSAVAQACRDAHVTTPMLTLGLPRAFIPHGSRTTLLARAGLDGPGIARTVLDALTGHRPGHTAAGPTPTASGRAR